MDTNKDKINTFKDWMRSVYDIEDFLKISREGCIAGIEGMVFEEDTEFLYDHHKKELWRVLKSLATPAYNYNPLLYLAGLRLSKSVVDELSLKQLIVWRVAEFYALDIIKELEYIDSL